MTRLLLGAFIASLPQYRQMGRIYTTDMDGVWCAFGTGWGGCGRVGCGRTESVHDERRCGMSYENVSDESLGSGRDKAYASFRWWKARKEELETQYGTAKRTTDSYLAELVAIESEQAKRKREAERD